MGQDTEHGETSVRNPWHKQSRWINWGIGIGVVILIPVVMSLIRITPYAEYVNKRYGVAMKYPAFWRQVNEPMENGVVAFISPKSDDMDAFMENVNVTFVPMTTKDVNLDNFTKLTIHQMTGTFGEYLKVLKSGRAGLGGRPAYQFMYVGQIEGVTEHMQYWHVWTVTSRGAYIITFSSPSATFKRYYPYARAIVRSFHFLN